MVRVGLAGYSFTRRGFHAYLIRECRISMNAARV